MYFIYLSFKSPFALQERRRRGEDIPVVRAKMPVHQKFPQSPFPLLPHLLVILVISATPANLQQPTSNFLDFREAAAKQQHQLKNPAVDNDVIISSDFNEFENIFEHFDTFSWDKLSPQNLQDLAASAMNGFANSNGGGGEEESAAAAAAALAMASGQHYSKLTLASNCFDFQLLAT